MGDHTQPLQPHPTASVDVSQWLHLSTLLFWFRKRTACGVLMQTGVISRCGTADQKPEVPIEPESYHCCHFPSTGGCPEAIETVAPLHCPKTLQLQRRDNLQMSGEQCVMVLNCRSPLLGWTPLSDKLGVSWTWNKSRNRAWKAAVCPERPRHLWAVEVPGARPARGGASAAVHARGRGRWRRWH